MPEIKKKRKINRAWNSYIEPRRDEADIYRMLEQRRIRDHYNKLRGNR